MGYFPINRLGVMPRAFDADISDRIVATKAIVAATAQTTDNPDKPVSTPILLPTKTIFEAEPLTTNESDPYRVGKELISDQKLQSLKYMYFNREGTREAIADMLLNEIKDGSQILLTWQEELSSAAADNQYDQSIDNAINQASTSDFFESEAFQKYGKFIVLAIGGWIVYDSFFSKKKSKPQIGFNRW